MYSLQVGAKDFCFLRKVLPVSRVHPIFYSVCIFSFVRVKRLGASLTIYIYPVPKLKMGGSIPLIPLYDFMVFPRTILRSALPDIIRTTIPKVGQAERSRHRSSKIFNKIWSERKKNLEHVTKDRKVTLKWILRSRVWVCELESSGLN
jgi:hypothetical protein